MSSDDQLDHNIAAARAMIDAGNFQAAERYIRLVLEDDADSLAGYALKRHYFIAQSQQTAAFEVSRNRIESVPECPFARIDSLVYQGAYLDRRTFMLALNDAAESFAGDGPMMADLHTLRVFYLYPYKQAAARIRELRADPVEGSLLDVDVLQARLDTAHGRLATPQRINAAKLAEGDIDAEILMEQGALAFSSGIAVAARRYAAQAAELDASYTRQARDLRRSATVALIPVFWSGYAGHYLLNAMRSTNGFGRWILAHVMLAVLGAPVLGLAIAVDDGASVPPIAWWVGGAVTVAGVIFFFHVFNGLSRWTAKPGAVKTKDVKLSKDY